MELLTIKHKIFKLILYFYFFFLMQFKVENRRLPSLVYVERQMNIINSSLKRQFTEEEGNLRIIKHFNYKKKKKYENAVI